MATAALTNIPTTIDLAEGTGAWGGDTFATDSDIKVQGNSSVSCTFTPSAGSNQEIYVTGTWDFTGTGVGDQHLRLWMNNTITSYLETEALDGIQIFLYDGTNTAYWTVGGSDTYFGGWDQFLLYTGDTATSGTVDKSIVTRIGIRMAVHTRPRNAINLWLDAWRYGDGYTVTGGTSGDEIDWSHIASVDLTNGYGMVTDVDSVYFVSGEITIGDGISTTYFKDEGQILVFKDLPVLSTLYKIIFFDDASALTNIEILGGVYSAAGTQGFTFDASETTINSFDMSGKQISRLDGATFHAGADIQNCVFDDCLQVVPTTATFKHNTMSNSTATDGAILFPTDDTNITDLTFINCDNGVEYDATSDSTDPAIVNWVFDDVSGNYDFNNTSGAAETINLSGSSNANSYNPGGDVVTFSGSVDMTVSLIDGDRIAIENVQTSIQLLNSPYTQLMNEDSSVLGIAFETYTGSTPVDVVVKARKSETTDDPRYYPESQISTVEADTGLSLTIQMRVNTFL